MLLKSRSQTHHPNMHYSYSGDRHKNMPFIQIYPKMFYSYTGGEHKNMLVRFSIHQINALSSCQYLLKVLLQKRGMGYAKVIQKKKEEKKRSEKKWTQKCSRYLKQWVLRGPPEKKKQMNKQPLLSSKCFQISNQRYVCKEQSRIKLAIIYPSYIHTHAHLDLIV